MCVGASSIYSDSVAKANRYIFDFEKYYNYIMYDNMPYNYVDGKNKHNELFKSGGFISKDEYSITNLYEQSYLATGIEYWTLTQQDADRNYVLDFLLKGKLLTESTDVRVTEFVKNDVRVKGTGSKSTPWEFLYIKSVNLYSSDKNKGTLSKEDCTDISQGDENLILSIYGDIDSEFYSCIKPSFRYKGTTCSAYVIPVSGDNKFIVESNIDDNLKCRVDFGYETYEISLKPCDNCIQAEPPKIFLAKNHDNFFDDEWGSRVFERLTKLPEKVGYKFDGYFYDGNKIIDSSGKIHNDGDSNRANDPVNIINGDATIISQFIANKYNITYDLAGGTYDGELPSSVKFDEVIQLNNPLRTGYTFGGWTIVSGLDVSTAKHGNSSNPTSAISSSSTKIKSVYFKNITPVNNAEVKFVANWIKNNYQVTISVNNSSYGTVSKSTLSIPYETTYTVSGNKITFDDVSNSTVTASVTDLAGYDTTVDSWSSTSGTITKETTITVNFARKEAKFTVTFNANTGTVSPATTTVTYNSPYGTLPTPTKANNNFLGWYTTKSSSDGVKITSGTTVTKTSNHTLYARWEPVHTLPIFTYTKKFQLVTDKDTIIDEGSNRKVVIPDAYLDYQGNWKIRLLETGKLTFHELRSAANGVDTFIVGGGGNGGTAYGKQAGNHGYSAGGAGGGGGELVLVKGVSVTTTSYDITIGGAANKSVAFGYTANPGSVGGSNQGSLSECHYGPDPGAGGTGGTKSNGSTIISYQGGAGGRGGVNACSPYHGGAGRCEFFDCNTYSKKYGGGGGGGHGHNGGAAVFGHPGNGVDGGGNGNNFVHSSLGTNDKKHHGTANTGGGGGGSSFKLKSLTAPSGCWTSNGCYKISSTDYIQQAGTGGSGIVILRNKR